MGNLMKNRSSHILKNIGCLALLFSVTHHGVEATRATSMALVNQQIEALSGAVHQALLEQGTGIEQMSESEIRSSVAEHLANFLDSSSDRMEMFPTEENMVMLGHKHHHKKGKKHAHAVPTANLAAASSKDIYQDKRMGNAMGLPNPSAQQNGQFVNVPIDEVDAVRLHITPTFARDIVDSVTLKAFRKVIGYDTFASILQQNRDEVKDPDDHYNITVSMMVRRIPPPRASKSLDQWNGGELITPKLDKGFPYDDGDNTITDAAPRFKKTGPVEATTVGKLNGENVTKEALKNLIQDRTMPVTQELIQLEADVSGDADNVFKLMDANVTKGQMKNLITDKPAPITVKLAQTSGDGDNVFKLMDENVTKGQMKNLITDKPAPITVKLAQTSDDGDNVFKLMDANVTKGQMKNLI